MVGYPLLPVPWRNGQGKSGRGKREFPSKTSGRQVGTSRARCCARQGTGGQRRRGAVLQGGWLAGSLLSSPGAQTEDVEVNRRKKHLYAIPSYLQSQKIDRDKI